MVGGCSNPLLIMFRYTPSDEDLAAYNIHSRIYDAHWNYRIRNKLNGNKIVFFEVRPDYFVNCNKSLYLPFVYSKYFIGVYHSSIKEYKDNPT